MFESKEAFVQSFKAKYPDYKNVPDSMLADKLLAKFPQYESQINPIAASTEAPGIVKAGVEAISKGLNRMPVIGTTKKAVEKGLEAVDQVIGDENKEFSVADVVTETVQNVTQIPKAIGEGFQQARESTARRSEVMNPIAEQKGALGEKAMKMGTGVLNTLDYASKLIGGAISPLAEPTIKAAIENLSPEAQDSLNDTIQSITAKFESLSPEHQEALRGTGILGEALISVVGGPALSKTGKQTLKVGQKVGQEVAEAATTAIKNAPEALRPIVTRLGDKVDSAVNRLEGLFKGQDIDLPKLKEQRNQLALELSDNFYQALPTDYKRDLRTSKPLLDDYMQTFAESVQSTQNLTIMEKGANKLTNAIKSIEKKIKATGNKIGDFREKISTVKVQPTRLDPVLQRFDDSLAKFGLKYENGAITQVSGRKTKLSPSEIKQLEAMRTDLIDIKESPTAQMIVDVRSKIDSDINFAKDRRDISSNLDGIAKSTRADLAEVNREVIGKEQAAILERYSDLNDLIMDYRKVSGKGKNLEFFLKRIMSERGRTPKAIANKIKAETGVDLTQDAIIIDAITSYLAPQRMKGRFQQEISNAGLDAGSVMGGAIGMATNPVGTVSAVAAKTVLNKLIKKFKDTPLQKTWEKLLKNDETMLELQKVLDEAIESAQSKRNTTQSMQTITDKTSIKNINNQPKITTKIKETQANTMIPDSALIEKLTDAQRKRFNAGTPAEQERALETLRLKYALENNIEYDPTTL